VSFLLRPDILTNHLVMLLVHAAIFMTNIFIQAFSTWVTPPALRTSIFF